jgi:hypothetical protein
MEKSMKHVTQGLKFSKCIVFSLIKEPRIIFVTVSRKLTLKLIKNALVPPYHFNFEEIRQK